MKTLSSNQPSTTKQVLIPPVPDYTPEQCARVYLLALLWPEKYELRIFEGWTEEWDRKINQFLQGENTHE